MAYAPRLIGIFVALVAAASIAHASPAGDEMGFIGVQIKMNPNGDGMIVVGFAENSPGEKAGLKEDDLILKANGNKVGTIKEFVDAVRATKPGETILLKLKRADKEMELKIKVGKAP